MRTVGAYEAKTHLGQLLDEVERGERITITRHGQPVAILSPATARPPLDPAERERILAAFAGIRERVSKVLIPGPSIREMVEEGRR